MVESVGHLHGCQSEETPPQSGAEPGSRWGGGWGVSAGLGAGGVF